MDLLSWGLIIKDGIAGRVYTTKFSVTLNNNKNYGNMRGNGASQIGGIVGSVDGTSDGTTITGNVNEGQILLEGDQSREIGGITGKFYGTNLTLCGNTNKENGTICIKTGKQNAYDYYIRRNNRK